MISAESLKTSWVWGRGRCEEGEGAEGVETGVPRYRTLAHLLIRTELAAPRPALTQSSLLPLLPNANFPPLQ